MCQNDCAKHKNRKILKANCENQKFETEKAWKIIQHQGELMTDLFHGGRTTYLGINGEEDAFFRAGKV